MMRIILLLTLFVLIIGCQTQEQVQENEPQTTGMEEVTGKYVGELRETACNSADKAGTCETRLASLGFITKEDCCKTYLKCC